MDSSQPPSYTESTSSVRDDILMYDVRIYDSHIVIHMKPDHAQKLRAQSVKVLSYEGNIKKQDDQTSDEYTEILTLARQRINDMKYKLCNISLDTCTIQIIIESYFKITVVLNCFVPETTSDQQHLQPVQLQQDLIFLAYIPPLHISLTKLCIDNVRSESILRDDFTLNSNGHLFHKSLHHFDELLKFRRTDGLHGLPNHSTIYCLDMSLVEHCFTPTWNGYTKKGKTMTFCALHQRKIVNFSKLISPTEIGVSYFHDSTFSFISQLINLTDLVIYDSEVISINLSNNRKLKNITLCAPKLNDLSTIKGLPDVEFIDVCETAIIDSSIFVTLPRLQKIVTSHMSKNIDGLAQRGIQILSYDDPKDGFKNSYHYMNKLYYYFKKSVYKLKLVYIL